MNHKVVKAYFDYVREERWLNVMSDKGYHLKNYRFMLYTFEKNEDIQYFYRIELLDHMPGHEKSQAYFSFLEETGVEVLTTYFRWVYLRKPLSHGAFDLFSDYESKIKHHRKILTLQVSIGLANLAIGFSNISMSSERNTVSLAAGSLSLSVALLLLSLGLRSYFRIKKLEREKLISES
ncbi:MAG: DUF2812 domain-containing protein [Spirochaetales bacterium]|nr:DUF2812 domain-containing protein [Spirochaetales bacterium]